MSELNINFAKETKDGVVLSVQLTPNSSRNEIIGYTDDFIKIKVSAPPNENKANKKLIEFVCETFDVSKSNVKFLSGEKSRIKKLLIKNIIYNDLIKKIFVYDKL